MRLYIPVVGAKPFLFGGILLLICLKIFLTSYQELEGHALRVHDDALFLRGAASIVEGNWLGEYDQFTLIKGPFFSIFIAWTHLLGISLSLAQHLFYAFACLMIIVALKPAVKSKWVLLGAFAVLWFNPATMETGEHLRIFRSNVGLPLVLLTFASFIGIHIRREQNPISLIPWIILGGLALGAFWLTREDTVWIIPSLMLLGGFSCFTLLLNEVKRKAGFNLIAIYVFIPVIAMMTVIPVKYLNARHYGVSLITETKHPVFLDLYGAMSRVRLAERTPFVPVPEEARRVIYEHSPFARNFASQMELYKNHFPDQKITGGWFIWAFRDAMWLSGLMPDAVTAFENYRIIAGEINEAADKGLFDAYPRRSTLRPPIHLEDFKKIAGDFFRVGVYFFSLEDFEFSREVQSIGTPEQLSKIAGFTRSRIAPVKGDLPDAQRQNTKRDHLLANVVSLLGWAWKIMFPLSFILALSVLFIVVLNAIRFRRLPFYLVLFLSAAGGCLSMILIGAIITATSFPAFKTLYFTSHYGLWLLACIALYLAWMDLRGLNLKKES